MLSSFGVFWALHLALRYIFSATCITSAGKEAFGSRSCIALFLLCFIPLGICLGMPFHLLTTNDA
jgi:hypothetical protein